MPYFRPFESYALFLLQKMNTLGTQSAHLSPPSRGSNSCMLRMPMFLFSRERKRGVA